jgi:glutamine amidotransferase PdxT
LGGGGVQSDVFSLTSQIRGVVLPNGTASVLFFGKHGTGPFCYGEVPTECTDPSNTYKGGHAYPYVPHVWAYNANDLAAVKAGKKRPWDVTPYAVWNLSDLGADIGGVAVDPATGRIFVIEIYGNGTMPRAHVYTISGASAPTADTTVPSVSISKPAAAATLTGTTTLAATATDNVGISSVWFTVDGTTVGPEVPTSPFQLTWDTTGVTNGSHVIRALARDAAGNVGQSAPVTVTVSNTTPQEPSVPTAIITAPAAGATVSGTVAVTATVSTAVAGVRFTLDGATLGAEDTSAPYTVSWATTGTANGSHTLRAIARNANGQTSTSGAVTITVNNAVADTSAPTVSLTAPASRARLTGTVTVSATASDNVGVAGVQFTLDGASLGAEDTSAPFTITWNTATAANGSHTLRAIARDAAGNTRTSSARTVSVTNTASDASAPTVAVTAPTANATVSKTVTLTASATDTVGVVGVQFAVDGLTVGAEDLTAPYSVAWNTALTTNGAHVITATARDAAGNRRTSSGVSVTVRNVGTDVVSDMNGDALPDLLFEHTNGQLYAWYLNGSTLSSSTSLSPGAVNPVWRVVSRDDFNGDKKADLLWQNTATGQVYLWYLDGATMIDDAWVLTDASPWQVATTADFNGDGKPDILWQQPATGQLAVWLMNGATLISSTTLTPGQWDPTWRVAGAADLNHDGKADLIWQNRATGALAYWLLQGLTATVVANFTPAATNLLWEIRAVADYNRDGQPDLLFQHAITGQMYVWYLTGTTMTGGAYLSPAQVQPDWRIVGGR